MGNTRKNQEELIPGLPNDVAELCLLHLPYPYTSIVRSVSSSWNKAVKEPSFVLSKKSLSLSLPFLFIFASDKSTATIQWQALDPRSGRRFVLPPMPCPDDDVLCPESFAVAALPRHGRLFVLGGKRSGAGETTGETTVYSTSTNQWAPGRPMRAPRAFFHAAAAAGRIVAVTGDGAEVYDPESDTWREAEAPPETAAGWSAAVAVGGEVWVTEGWTWPFVRSPRGAIYDVERDTWRETGRGMSSGWTGVSAVVGERLVVVSEYGDCPVKIYDPDRDTWRYVVGEKFPCGALRRPFSVIGLDGQIFVVARGLNVGIGSLKEEQNGEFSVTWRVLPAPNAFRGFSPSSCQVLYA